MKKIIITIGILIGLSVSAQAKSLESELESIISQAETCLKNKDCKALIEANPMVHKVMSNSDYVKKLAYDCLPGSECYSLSMVAADLYIKASMQVLEGAFN